MPLPAHTAEQSTKYRSTALSGLPLVGRVREVAKLLELARAKTPALICGPPGTGKTRLLLELASRLSADAVDFIYIGLQRPLHAFLLDIAGRVAVKPTSASSVALRGALWKIFDSKPHVFLLDDIAEITPPYYRFFQRILAAGENTIVGAAAHAHSAGELQRIFWNHQAIVSLRNLSKRDGSTLAQSAISAFSSDLSMPPDFAIRVARNARGNPGQIVEMCIRAADPAYRTVDHQIRFGALVMDSLIGL